jgi:hypothetical protein
MHYLTLNSFQNPDDPFNVSSKRIRSVAESDVNVGRVSSEQKCGFEGVSKARK